jgi:hypothetical protein
MNLARRGIATEGLPGQSISRAVQGLIDALRIQNVPDEMMTPLTDAYQAFGQGRRRSGRSVL